MKGRIKWIVIGVLLILLIGSTMPMIVDHLFYLSRPWLDLETVQLENLIDDHGHGSFLNGKDN